MQVLFFIYESITVILIGENKIKKTIKSRKHIFYSNHNHIALDLSLGTIEDKSKHQICFPQLEKGLQILFSTDALM